MLSGVLCECGCGQQTLLIAQTARRKGRVRGEPNRFVAGHQSRVLRKSTAELERTCVARVARAVAVKRARLLADPARLQVERDRLRAVASRRRAQRRGAKCETVNAIVLLEMDDGVCGICGQDVDPLRFEIDHVLPLSKGGEHSYVNTQVAHPTCNRSKGVNHGDS